MAGIELSGIAKAYGRVEVLRDVDVALGSTVVLTPDLARLHPFDAEGRRVVSGQ
jgi:hypothetical protein